jgi:hypothetical protein
VAVDLRILASSKPIADEKFALPFWQNRGDDKNGEGKISIARGNGASRGGQANKNHIRMTGLAS